MSVQRQSATTAAALLVNGVIIIATFLRDVQGHLYMMTPIARNFWATTTFNDVDFEDITFCPHCYDSKGPADIRARAENKTDPLELSLYGNGSWPHLSAYERRELAPNGNYLEIDAIAVRHGICGDPEQRDVESSNRFGKENTNYPVLETYIEGSILEAKIVVSAHHMGHLEFFLCNTADMDDPDGVVTQGCFNMHPLDRAEDDGGASPIDPNFPGRYYLDPSCRALETDQTMIPGAFPGHVVTARYQLPSSVTCSRCIVQMVYYTGNSCKHPGYDEFNPESWPSECASTKEGWIATSLNVCGDGDNYPEEYWNCADIEIVSDGSSSESDTTAQIVDESATLETLVPVFGESAISEAPAPVLGASATSETPAPVFGESAISETSAPTGTLARPFSEPVSTGITLPPATSTSSGATSEQSSDECDDAVEAYGQCGGKSYEGPTCCLSGYECIERSAWYSQCVPESRT